MSLTRTILSISFSFLLAVCATGAAWAQAGITASPTRLYFKPGGPQEQIVSVTNPNKDKPLEIGVAMNDWNYDSLGNNVSYEAGTLASSCALNVKVMPGSYFTLGPGETKELSITVAPPKSGQGPSVKTAMLYLTQLNPGTGTNEQGAAIKVTVRMGIKIYYTSETKLKPQIDIVDFGTLKGPQGRPSGFRLRMDNTGNGWLNGFIHYDLVNKKSGMKYKLPSTEFYSLPDDKRVFYVDFPEQMEAGDYTATAVVNIGDNESLQLAELDFSY